MNNSMENTMENSIEENRVLTPHAQHRYNLDTTSHVPDMPRIISKPVEYT